MGRNSRVRLGAALLLLATGCTTVPSRFTKDPAAGRGCSYYMVSAGRDGFVLEIFYKQYSFWDVPDPVLQAARLCFQRSAGLVGKRLGKRIVLPNVADMAATTNRNRMDGYLNVYVTGRVWFARETGALDLATEAER